MANLCKEGRRNILIATNVLTNADARSITYNDILS